MQWNTTAHGSIKLVISYCIYGTVAVEMQKLEDQLAKTLSTSVVLSNDWKNHYSNGKIPDVIPNATYMKRFCK